MTTKPKNTRKSASTDPVLQRHPKQGIGGPTPKLMDDCQHVSFRHSESIVCRELSQHPLLIIWVRSYPIQALPEARRFHTGPANMSARISKAAKEGVAKMLGGLRALMLNGVRATRTIGDLTSVYPKGTLGMCNGAAGRCCRPLGRTA